MKNVKKLAFGLFTMVMAFGLVFTIQNLTSANTQPKSVSYFYKYNGPDFSEAEIRDYTNYERSENTCEDGTNLCGVFLASDPIGTDHPVLSELNAVADDLWTSQDNGYSVAPETILMKD